MHHEPRGSCALTLPEWESPTIAHKLPFYYSALRKCGKCESAENNVARGRGALQCCFFLSWALKYPVSRVLLRI